MPFSTLLLSTATVGMTTLAFAIAAPASAQEHYGQRHYTHTHYHHYAHSHYRHYAHYNEGRQIIVHPQETTLVPAQGYVWGPVGAVGTVVGGTGYAVGGVFTGAGMIVEGVVGECLAAWRLSSAPRLRRPTHTAPLSPRRSMGLGQWPWRRSRQWVALSERRSPTPSTEPLPATASLDHIRGRAR